MRASARRLLEALRTGTIVGRGRSSAGLAKYLVIARFRFRTVTRAAMPRAWEAAPGPSNEVRMERAMAFEPAESCRKYRQGTGAD